MIKISKLLNGKWAHSTTNNVLYVSELKKFWRCGDKREKLAKELNEAQVSENNEFATIVILENNYLFELLRHTVTKSFSTVVVKDSLK